MRRTQANMDETDANDFRFVFLIFKHVYLKRCPKTNPLIYKIMTIFFRPMSAFANGKVFYP